MSIEIIEHGPNAGLPTLESGENPTSFYEFWPVWVFYLPVIFCWLWWAVRFRGMGLPLAANPHVFLAGMIGESKVDLLDSAGEAARAHILPFVSFVTTGDCVLDQSRAEQLMQKHKLSYPLVAKPDKGCRGAGVQVISDAEALTHYLSVFPVGQKLMLQVLSGYKAEAGVFYVRMPDEEKGKVVSITLKYRATVTGDGKATLGELVKGDPRASELMDLYYERLKDSWHTIPAANEEIPLVFAGSHCRGAVFKDGCSYISDELSDKIDTLMQDFPAFYYGRLDIKFDNMNTFCLGKDFDVIEVNGASSEQTHIWDSHTPVLNVFKTLLTQYRTLFKIGASLRDRGMLVPSITTLIKVWLHEFTSDQKYPKTH